ncbi:hypothetical protein [Haloarcula regularis]|uniref:hypothetical protein n=1 Tax=Haloarcula regularis TaxID=3033392 RepID=UPI0023E7A84A|nr:hypothetical protein [Halomicroarcula sp. SYNS111]
MPERVYDKFDYDTHWVSERLERGLWGIENPLILGILKFSMPWNVLALIYSVLFWETLTPVFIYSSAFGLLWVNIAPYLIWYYDERVLPEFFTDLSELLTDEQERADIAKKYNEFFARHRLSVSAFWTVSIASIIYVSEPALTTMGMSGAGSLFLYTTYAYGIYIGAVLGHGFVGPVTTILLIHEITKYDLEIDPLHPDGLGGAEYRRLNRDPDDAPLFFSLPVSPTPLLLCRFGWNDSSHIWDHWHLHFDDIPVVPVSDSYREPARPTISRFSTRGSQTAVCHGRAADTYSR